MAKCVAAMAAAALLALAAGLARADTVTLQDGRTIHGKVTSPDGAAMVEITTDAGVMRYPASLVKSIVKGTQPAPAGLTPTGSAGFGAAPPASHGNGTLDGPKFVQAKAQADPARTAEDGLAIWKKLVADNPVGPMIEQAKRELALWQQRVDQNMVRFGPQQWLAKSVVDERVAKAEEAVAKGEAATDTDEAVKLFDQAAQFNPFRADIPFRKAVRCYGAGRERLFGIAMGEVLKIDANHVASRNNLAVLSAQQKDWMAAFAGFKKAGAAQAPTDQADNPVILDNIYAAMALAEQNNAPPDAAKAGHAAVQAVTKAMEQAGKNNGKVRWGNTWITPPEYQQNVRKAEQADEALAVLKKKLAALEALDAQITAANNRLREQIVYYKKRELQKIPGSWTAANTIQTQVNHNEIKQKQVQQEIAQVRGQVLAAEGQRIVPPYPAKLVLVDEQLAEIGTVDVGLPAGGPLAPPALRPPEL